MDEILQTVRDALAAAAENGYSFDGWTVEEIADDMYACGGVDFGMGRAEVETAIRTCIESPL